jgi:hypothetical protein
VTTLHLLLKLRWLLFARWIRDNLFDALVLSPLIIFGVYRAVGHHLERLLSHLPSILGYGFWRPVAAVGLFLTIKLMLSWRVVMEEVHPQSTPDACLLYLPIDRSERYISLFLHRGFKNCLLVLLLGLLLVPAFSSKIIPLLAVGALATGLEIGLGLVWTELLPRAFQPMSLRYHSVAKIRQGLAASLRWVFRKALGRHLDEDLRASVVRDILLTLRFFSLGVLLHFIAALLCLTAMVNILPEVKEEARAVQVVTGLTTAYGVAMIALLSPRLLKFQLPYWWIERSAPVSPRSIWHAKVWHANAIVMLFPCLVVLVRLWLVPVPWWQACLIAVEQILTGVLVASFIGALVFETHQQPWLGVLFSGLGSTAFGLMMVLLHWGLFFVLFPGLMHWFAERGEARIRFLLLAHDPN